MYNEGGRGGGTSKTWSCVPRVWTAPRIWNERAGQNSDIQSVSYKLTQIQFTNALDVGKVF